MLLMKFNQKSALREFNGMESKNSNIQFISFLRGLACLIIVAGHLVLTYFFADNWDVFPYIPLLQFDNSLFLKVFSFLYSWGFKAGSFGVAIFFFITGFTTLMSLERDNSVKYIVKRVVRLYPTYIVGFSIVLIFIYCFCIYRGVDVPFSKGDCLRHMTFLRNFMLSSYIDNGVWTLEINYIFYLLVWCAYKIKNKKIFSYININVLSVILFFIFLMCNYLVLHAASSRLIYKVNVIVELIPYITYSLIGSLWYYEYSGQINRRQFCLSIILLLMEFLIENSYRTNNPTDVVGYIYALSFIGLLYYIRNDIRCPRIIRFISSISYPLYIVHALVGYILMSYFIMNNINAYVALLFSLIIIISISCLLHFTVEKYSVFLGKKICSRKYPLFIKVILAVVYIIALLLCIIS